MDNFTDQLAQQYNDQQTVVYDSFERESGCRYFAIIDQDEFFIPGKYKILREMLVSIYTVRVYIQFYIILTRLALK